MYRIIRSVYVCVCVCMSNSIALTSDECIDGEIPKTSNSTFGNCSGEGKNCPILLTHY